MEFPPQKFREMVFQLLFSFEMGGDVGSELIPFLMAELAVSKKNVSAAYEQACTIWQKREELDQIIRERSQEYSLERIKSVEKSALRLAFYERLIEKKVSPKIIIAEAHRLTRKFSALEGASFVNAVLDSLEKASDEPSLPAPDAETTV